MRRGGAEKTVRNSKLKLENVVLRYLRTGVMATDTEGIIYLNAENKRRVSKTSTEIKARTNYAKLWESVVQGVQSFFKLKKFNTEAIGATF